MRPVGPPGSGARMQRSVAACLASILELDVARVPLPDEWHPQPWTVWRQWLGQRGLGLVPIAGPANFHWSGAWLAMVGGAEGDGLVAGGGVGAPPGLAWSALGGLETFHAVQFGSLIAPADVVLWEPSFDV